MDRARQQKVKSKGDIARIVPDCVTQFSCYFDGEYWVVSWINP